jgi:hypothetical protein
VTRPVRIAEIRTGDVIAALDGAPWRVVDDGQTRTRGRGHYLELEPADQPGAVVPIILEPDAILWRYSA